MPEIENNTPFEDIKKELYGDLNPDFYGNLLKIASKKVADLDYNTRVHISSLMKSMEPLGVNIDVNKGDYDKLSKLRPPYKLYRQLYEKVPELYQGINIIIDNILSPDDSTKKSIKIDLPIDSSIQDEFMNKVKIFTENILHNIKLEEKLPACLKESITVGDSYFEIISLNDYIGNIKILSESDELRLNSELHKIDLKSSILEFKVENIDNKFIKYNLNIIENKDNLMELKENLSIVPMDVSILQENSFHSNIDKVLHESNREINLNELNSIIHEVYGDTDNEIDVSAIDIELLKHRPENVVVIGDNFNTIGYIVLYTDNTFNDVSVLGANKTVVDNFVDKIINVLRTSDTKVKDIFDNKPGLKSEIKHLITTRNIKSLRLRFVPNDRMEHFKISSSETHPYGESTLYPVKDIGKYIIAAETAMLIYRLTRAVEKYIYKVDVGKEKARTQEILNELMRSQKQKLYAVTQSGDIDALLSNITTFEDIYTAMVDGRDLITVDVVQGGELNTKIDDLNYFKDKMMAATPVPNIYLKQENEESKYTLSQENVRFARTIIRLQKDFSTQIKSLILKVVNIIDPSMLHFVSRLNIYLRPPVSLQMERESEMIGNIQNIVQTLENFGLPKEAILREYLSKFDLSIIENIQQMVQKINDITAGSSNDEEGMD